MLLLSLVFIIPPAPALTSAPPSLLSSPTPPPSVELTSELLISFSVEVVFITAVLGGRNKTFTRELYRSSLGALASCVDVHMHDRGSFNTGSPDGKCLCFLRRCRLRGLETAELGRESKLTCAVDGFLGGTVTVEGGSTANRLLLL